MARARPVPPTRADVLDASSRIAGLVRPVTVVDAPHLRQSAVLAVETLQPTGSFKVRGALTALMPLASGTHVVSASMGNHALAVGHAAAVLELEATVVVPETAEPSKLAALEALDVKLVKYGASYDTAERHALKLASKDGRFISPYNDRLVVAGQGTIAVELLKRIEGALTVVCPVGGGGLLSGVALWATQRTGVRVVGVGAENAPALSQAFDGGGKSKKVKGKSTLADSLAGNLEEGAITLDLAQRYVESIVSVTEKQIESAMRYLATRHGLIVEGAGAVATAAVLAEKIDFGNTRPVILVTGRNVSPQTAAKILRTKGR